MGSSSCLVSAQCPFQNVCGYQGLAFSRLPLALTFWFFWIIVHTSFSILIYILASREIQLLFWFLQNSNFCDRYYWMLVVGWQIWTLKEEQTPYVPSDLKLNILSLRFSNSSFMPSSTLALLAPPSQDPSLPPSNLYNVCYVVWLAFTGFVLRLSSRHPEWRQIFRTY